VTEAQDEKLEIRNPKSETNSNDQNTKDQNHVWNFGNYNLGFVSSFEFSISNFSKLCAAVSILAVRVS